MQRAIQQLQLLHKIESDKEAECAKNLKAAQSFLDSNLAKLKEAHAYKVDYLKRMQQEGQAGVRGGNYQHLQNFIVQLDEGIFAQQNAVDTAKQVVEQRRKIWLEQRTKVKAVDTLISNKKSQYQLVINKQEQNLADEFASQKFIRAKMAAKA
jgi:flagellar FliJ protein